MNAKTMDSKNINIAASKDKFMEDLRLEVTNTEELRHTTTEQADEGTATAHARFLKSLQVVKERLVAAETSVIERTRQAAKVPGQFIHDNHWNWH